MGAYWDFNNCQVEQEDIDATRREDLCDAEFREADVQGIAFIEKDLLRADFRGADLRRANFEDCDLRDAQFQGAWVHGATFIRCTWRENTLKYANQDHYTTFEDCRIITKFDEQREAIRVQQGREPARIELYPRQQVPPIEESETEEPKRRFRLF